MMKTGINRSGAPVIRIELTIVLVFFCAPFVQASDLTAREDLKEIPSFDSGEGFVIDVLANDTDSKGFPMGIISAMPGNCNAIVNVADEGEYVWFVPLTGFAGVCSLQYTVENEYLTQATAPVQIMGPGSVPEPDQPVLLEATKDVFYIDGDGSGGLTSGDTLLYRITITNPNIVSVTGVSLMDTPDQNTSTIGGSISSSQGAVVPAGMDVRVDLGVLRPRRSATVEFSVLVDPELPGPTLISNQGAVIYLDGEGESRTIMTDDPETALAGDATTVSVSGAGLTAEMSDSRLIDANGDGHTGPGDTLSYTINIVNTGDLTLSNILFKDAPDASTRVVPGTVLTNRGSVTSEWPGVEVNLGSLAEDLSATISFQVVIDEVLPASKTSVSNQGRITADLIPTVLTDDPATTALAGDATRTDLVVVPEGDELWFQLNVPDGETFRAGALVISGWTVAKHGISSLSYSLNDASAPDPTFYRWQDEEICRLTDRLAGFRDDACPWVRRFGILNTSSLDEGVDYRIEVSATPNVGDIESEIRSFQVINWSDQSYPTVQIEYPAIGGSEADPSPVEDKMTRFRGWAIDDSGVSDLSFSIDGYDIPIGSPIDTNWAYGLVRPEVCRDNGGVGDPNCEGHATVGWELTFDPSGYGAGPHKLEVTATDAWGHSSSASVFFEILAPGLIPGQPAPFTGQPFNIPSTDVVEDPDYWYWFANYDLGGAEVGYSDSSSGNSAIWECDYREPDDVDLRTNLGETSCGAWVENLEESDWLGYTANIAKAGYYRIRILLLSFVPGGRFHFELDGVPVTPEVDACADPVNCPVEEIVIPDIYLEPGPDGSGRQIRFAVDQDWTGVLGLFRFERQADPPQEGYGSAKAAATVTSGTNIPAENFDTTGIFIGQSIGYRDRSLGNQADSPWLPRAHEWVDVGTVAGGRVVVEDQQLGEWLEYTIDVQTAGTYEILLEYRNRSGTESNVDVLVDGVLEASVLLPPATGWKTGVVPQVELPQGECVLGISPRELGFDLDSFTLARCVGDPVCPGVSYEVEAGETLILPHTALACGGGAFREVETGPLHGALIASSSLLYYYPQANYLGQDHFTYKVFPACSTAPRVAVMVTPSASFTAVCTGVDCTFDASGSTPAAVIDSYGWFFGDGQVGEGAVATHQYASEPGIYDVTLQISCAEGQSASVSQQVTITPPPLTASFDIDCWGESCTFDASGSSPASDIVSYGWLYGDGEIGEGTVVTHNYILENRTYDASLFILSDAGQNAELTQQVAIDLLPVADFEASCQLRRCHFVSTSTDDNDAISSHVWDLGDGSTASGSEVVHEFDRWGQYSVTLTVTDSPKQQYDDVTMSVVVSPVPILLQMMNVLFQDRVPRASFVATCTGPDCTFDASASSDDEGITEYLWTFGDGEQATVPVPTVDHTYQASGSHVVTLQVTDTGEQTSSTTNAVTVDFLPVADFTVICSGPDCHFDGSASTDDMPGLAYHWDFGDGNGSNLAVVDHTYTTTGAHTATLTVTDTAEQSDSKSDEITIDLRPVARVSIDCDESWSCMFDGSASSDDHAIVSYLWTFHNGSEQSGALASYVYTENVMYTVTLTVTDDAQQTDSARRTFVPDEPPVAMFSYECDVRDCIFDGTASNDDNGIVLYTWSFGDDSPSVTGAEVAHTYSRKGVYLVRLVAADSSEQSGSREEEIRVSGGLVSRVMMIIRSATGP